MRAMSVTGAIRAWAALAVAVAWASFAALAADAVVFTPAKATGSYDVGEKVSWRVEAGAGAGVEGTAKYVLKAGGLTVLREGTLDLAAGPATVEVTLDAPNTLLLEVRARVAGKEQRFLAGAVVAPEKIRPSMPRPDDFDAFWESKLKDLAAVPANVRLEEADAGKPSVEYFKVTMDNVGGTHIYGQLARPKKEAGAKFPALLIVQWAGVYGLPKGNVVNRAEQGWLALNIMAHDLPFDRDEAFYRQAAATTLKDYVAIGNTDREKSYFLRMYLACYRAADYLAHREDWDGRTLVVMGTSQGGQQSVVTAGFHPKITAMIAHVPAGCDVTAEKAGRAFGFPYFAAHARRQKDVKILEVGRYFDAMNFAYRIKCPALVSVGLIDETCPPSGVLAACNQMQGPKEVLLMINSAHQDRNGSQAAFYRRSEAWLRALVKGEPAPVAK